MMPPGGFGADDYWGCLGLGPADETVKSLTSLTRRHGLLQPAAHAGATKGARTLTRRREGEAPPRGAGCCARACTVCAPQECSRRWRLLRSCSNYVAATSIQEKNACAGPHARNRNV